MFSFMMNEQKIAIQNFQTNSHPDSYTEHTRDISSYVFYPKIESCSNLLKLSTYFNNDQTEGLFVDFRTSFCIQNYFLFLRITRL